MNWVCLGKNWFAGHKRITASARALAASLVPRLPTFFDRFKYSDDKSLRASVLASCIPLNVGEEN